ncbi:MAG: trypsin-like peptidase domain-containing protein [Myxococcota bacterium]
MERVRAISEPFEGFSTRRFVVWALLYWALVATGCGPAEGETPKPLPPLPAELLDSERNTIEVFRRVAPSVVFVSNATTPRGAFRFSADELPQGAGSGFVWDDQGHIVTNYHVVHGGNRFTVTMADGTTYEADLVGIAPRKDLAVLRIEPDAALRPVLVGDSQQLVVGQKVLAIGNPFGLDSTLTTGVISALGREIESIAGTRIEDVIQTDASINPGNSGGPLLDSGGRVIGVTTAIYSTSGSSAGIGFAVPAATVARLVPELIEHGRVKWAGLGVRVMPDHIAAQWGVIGVVVRDVLPGSAAEDAGMRSIDVDRLGNVRALDVITHVAGRPVVRVVDLIDVLDDFEPGDSVKVRFDRDGRSREVEIALGELQN